MAEFVNTIDLLGDDAVIDSIINRTITEFKDDRIETIGSYAFAGCNKLVSIAVPAVTEVGGNAFRSCTGLKTLVLENTISLSSGAFSFCSALESVTLEKATYIGSDAFTWGGLARIDLHKAPTIYIKAFYGCGSLFVLVIRDTEKIASLANTAALTNSRISKGTGYIYVPKALLSDDDATKDYRRATNWSAFADQFRALEDYTVDGTTMGALDETKI